MTRIEELQLAFTKEVHRLSLEKLQHEARKAKAEADLAELGLEYAKVTIADDKGVLTFPKIKS